MNDLYKLEFEIVSSIGIGSQFYRNEKPICKPEVVPDEFWSKHGRETDNPWDQFNTLKRWVTTGEQLVRNVKLYKMKSVPEWEEVL